MPANVRQCRGHPPSRPQIPVPPPTAATTSGQNSWAQRMTAGRCRQIRRSDIFSPNRNSTAARSIHRDRSYHLQPYPGMAPANFQPVFVSSTGISFFEHPHFGAIFGAPQHGFARQVWARIAIHKECSIRRDADGMVGILRGKQLQSLSIKANAVQMRLIRIFVLLASVGQKSRLAGSSRRRARSAARPRGPALSGSRVARSCCRCRDDSSHRAPRPRESLLSAFDKVDKRFRRDRRMRIRLLAHQNFLLSG